MLKGRRGIIIKEGDIVIKKAKSKETAASIKREIQILLFLNKNNINFVPKIINYGEDRFSYKWIEGKTFLEILKNNKKEEIKNYLLDLVKKIKILDELKVEHGELLRPYKNIIANKEIYILDFDRGNLYSKNKKNIKSFAQFLLGKKILNIEEVKKINIIEDPYKFIFDKIKKWN